MSLLQPMRPEIFGHVLPLAQPGYLPVSGWIGHLPFASWLVGALKPRVLVELGVHNGASYCTFCEAVVQEGLSTACFGVDSWAGDPHAGFYSETVLAQLRAHHDPRYAAFSRLVQASFDEALEHFADGSVDLLHIDGFHTYEAVQHDFASWRPKLSERAAVLFHDTNVREGSFGVWRFWDEIRQGRPHFEFLHAHGLGVLGVGSEQPEALRRLFAADEAETGAIRSVFGQLGQRLVDLHDLQRRLEDRESQLSGSRSQVVEQDALLSGLHQEVQRHLDALHETRQSLERHQADVDQLKTDVDRLNADLDRCHRQQLEKQAEADSLEEALGQRTSEVQRLQHTLQEREDEVSRLVRQLSDESERAEYNKRLVNAVKRSRSWRLMAPFRRVGLFGRREKRIFKRPKKKEGHSEGSSSSDRARPAPAVYRLSHIQKTGPVGSAIGSGKHLVCVSHVSPFPPRAGNEYRIHRMLGWLRATGWTVTLVIAPLPGEELDDVAVASLTEAYPDVVLVRRDGRISYSLPAMRDVLAGLDGRQVEDYARVLGEPPTAGRLLEVERAFAHDPLIGVVRALVERLMPQVLLVNYIFMTRMLPSMPSGLLKLVDTHDVFSTKAEKVVRYGIRDDLSLTGLEEGRLLARADVVIAIQPDERRELESIAQGRPVVTVGVDVDVISDRPSPMGSSILLVASDNAMNVKGLEDFLEFAWPLVLRDVPNAEFLVAGSVGDAVDIDDARVRRLGRVDDLAALYAKARVVINPAVAGTGLKIKTVEALGQLCPLVAWPSGVDGFGGEVRGLCNVAENWYDFARAVVRCLRDDGTADAASQAERRAILDKFFSAGRVYAALDEVLSAKVGTEATRS